MELLERFLKYVGFDTQSDENSTTFPSTEKQKVLLACLAEEMKALGLQEVEMDRYGYDRRLSLGTIAGAGTLGILIPPSIPMVIYAINTEQSVGKIL